MYIIRSLEGSKQSIKPTYLMKEFFQHSDHYFFVHFDMEANILDTNELLQKETRFLDGVLVGRSFSELVFYKDFSSYQYLLEKSLAEGERKFNLEIRMVKSDGSDFNWTSWEFSIDSDNNGQYSVTGLGHLLSKFNEKEVQFPESINELHAKNTLLEGILQENLIGFWIWDIATQSDKLSLSLNEVLGYNSNIEQKNQKELKWKKHIHSSDRIRVNEKLKEHFDTQGKFPFHCEFRLKNLHKKDIWVLGYGKVMQWDADGNPLVMAGCFFDISERKKSEDLLEQQSQLLMTMTFNQSHLMRAKLANILGLLEIIDLKKPILETAHFFKIIKTEARKLDDELKKSISASNNLNPSPSENQEVA